MSFINPQGFWSLLLALPVIALYFLRLHYTDNVVPSLMLWQSVMQERHANRPWQKFRKHWLFFLQMLLLLLLVLSLAQPVLPSPVQFKPRVIVLMDVSASMWAQTETGGMRFENARQELRRTLTSVEGVETLTLIAVGLTPRVVVHRTDLQRFYLALSELEPSQGKADWDSAARLAQGLVGVEGTLNVTTILISDFAFSTTSAPASLNFPGELRIINVGEAAENVGFTHFSARKTGQYASVFIRVQNVGTAASRTLDINADGELFARQAIELPANDSMTFTFENIPAQGWIEARLLETDAFALDDRAWIALNRENQLAVLLLSSGNRFLTQAIANLPLVKLSQTADIGETASGEAYAALIVDKSPLPELPQANMWLIAPDDVSVCGNPEQEYIQPAAVQGDWQHPLLNYVDWSDVHISVARKYRVPAGSNILISSQEVPLLWTVESRGYRAVCTAFILQDSDLPLRLAFPIMTSNIMSWLASDVSIDPITSLSPGYMWVPSLPAQTESAILIDPQRNQHPVPLDGTGMVLGEVGLYHYVVTTQVTEESRFVAVSHLNAEESDLRPRNMELSAVESTTAQTPVGQRDISRIIIVFAVILCVLEGFLWWGRDLSDIKKPFATIMMNADHIIPIVIRCVLLLCLLGAFLGIRFRSRVRHNGIVFVVDRSESTRDSWNLQNTLIGQFLASKAPRDQVAIVVFGGDAWVDRSFSQSATAEEIASIPSREVTDIEQAVHLAAGILPADLIGRVVLLSDGLETQGQGLNALYDAVNQGIDVVLLQTGSGMPASEVWIPDIQVPTTIFPGDQVPIKVDLATNTPQTVRINWTVGSDAGYAYVDLVDALSTFQFSHRVVESGFLPLRVCIDPAEDRYIENNCVDNWLIVQSTPIILVAGAEEERLVLASAFRAGGLAVDEVLPQELPLSLENLVKYSAVILVNTPAREIPLQAFENLEVYVRDVGGGLVAVGGPHSYGVGGWLGTPLEKILPVDMRVLDPQRFPPMAMAVVIDTSGSMASEENGIPKIRLAAEAALRATESLNVGDTLVVVGYSDGPDQTIGPIDIGASHDIGQKLYTLQASGGGIFVYESLDYAQRLLMGTAQADNIQRHILILADGSDAEHQPGSVSLAQASVEMGISISSISIGAGDDISFLSTLADAGEGRFYFANNATDLPSIFTEDVARTKRSYIVEEPFYPVNAGLWAPVSQITVPPELLGYIATTPKSTSEVVLYASAYDPLLAVWQYGLGKTVAWTSDATSRWAANWVGKDDFVKFWGALVRQVMAEQADRDVDVRVSYDQSITHITVDVTGSPGRETDNLVMNVQISDGTQESPELTVSLPQVAPGRYAGEVVGLDRRPYLIRLFGDRNLVFGWSPPSAKEYLPGDATAAMAYLAERGGARLIADTALITSGTESTIHLGQPLILPLLTFAAVLWVCDISWRRLGLTYSGIHADIRHFWEWLVQKIKQTAIDGSAQQDGMAPRFRLRLHKNTSPVSTTRENQTSAVEPFPSSSEVEQHDAGSDPRTVDRIKREKNLAARLSQQLKNRKREP